MPRKATTLGLQARYPTSLPLRRAPWLQPGNLLQMPSKEQPKWPTSSLT
jgi:hypothetical protein